LDFFHSSFLVMLFWLFVGHFICDYPLQGDYLAQAKNRHTEIGKHVWRHALIGHGFIHAGAVVLATGSLFLGMLELIAHCYIDSMKNDGHLTFAQDQYLHYACKLAWAIVAYLAFFYFR